MMGFNEMKENELLEVDGGAVEVLIAGKVLTGAAAFGPIGIGVAVLAGAAALGFYVASKN